MPGSRFWTQRTRGATEARTEVTVKDKVDAASWGYTAVEISGACR